MATWVNYITTERRLAQTYGPTELKHRERLKFRGKKHKEREAKIKNGCET